ncbi:hypothetical protein ACLOJK_027597 [Asimina triloba]
MPVATIANVAASSMRTSVVVVGNGGRQQAVAMMVDDAEGMASGGGVVAGSASGGIGLTSGEGGAAKGGTGDGRPGSTDLGLAGDDDESGFEMGNDRRRMKVESSATEEASMPRVAAVIDVGLRPRRIWDGLDAAIMMDYLDGPIGYSLSVGFAGKKLSSSSPSSTHAGGVGW